MSNQSKQSLIPTTFYDQARQSRRSFYWLTPVIVLFLYLCVMGVFFWLQQLQSDSVMFITIDQETRQQRLFWVVVALSFLIVLSLLALWNYTRLDRKSTRLNSSHVAISYAVFCLKKKKQNTPHQS